MRCACMHHVHAGDYDFSRHNMNAMAAEYDNCQERLMALKGKCKPGVSGIQCMCI